MISVDDDEISTKVEGTWEDISCDIAKPFVCASPCGARPPPPPPRRPPPPPPQQNGQGSGGQCEAGQQPDPDPGPGLPQGCVPCPVSAPLSRLDAKVSATTLRTAGRGLGRRNRMQGMPLRSDSQPGPGRDGLHSAALAKPTAASSEPRILKRRTVRALQPRAGIGAADVGRRGRRMCQPRSGRSPCVHHERGRTGSAGGVGRRQRLDRPQVRERVSCSTRP